MPPEIATLYHLSKVAVNYSKYFKIYQHYPFQGAPKYTQLCIFGMKMHHLPTLGSTLGPKMSVPTASFQLLCQALRFLCTYSNNLADAGNSWATELIQSGLSLQTH
jgi:hypothetical protein